MPRIIVHIGTHKTATTSIQKFLFNNREELGTRGVLYPDYSIIEKDPHYAQLGMVNALSGQHKNYDASVAERFFKETKTRAQDYETTVISAEPFYRHAQIEPGSKIPKKRSKYWELRTEYINRIRDLLGPAEIIIVFRRQAEYAESLYQEHVKVTRYTGNFQTFCADMWFHFKFLQQARVWDAAFPGLKAFSFERLLQSGDIVTEFCRKLGLPVDDLPLPPRANEGLPVDLVVLKRTLHRSQQSRDDIRDQIDALLARMSADDLAFLKSRSFFASKAARETFQDKFAPENENLARFMQHDLAPGEPVFPPKSDQRMYGDRLHVQFLSRLVHYTLQGDHVTR